MSTSKTENEKGNWLDFETIKANADVTAVFFIYYGLIGRLVQRTNEFVGWFLMGTKKHGGTLDFVAEYQNFHLREAPEVVVMLHDGTVPYER